MFVIKEILNSLLLMKEKAKTNGMIPSMHFEQTPNTSVRFLKHLVLNITIKEVTRFIIIKEELSTARVTPKRIDKRVEKNREILILNNILNKRAAKGTIIGKRIASTTDPLLFKKTYSVSLANRSVNIKMQIIKENFLITRK